MKITVGKIVGSTLIVGIVVGSGFFALLKPPRRGERGGATHSQRPEIQTDEKRSEVEETLLANESEIATKKLIASRDASEPTPLVFAESVADAAYGLDRICFFADLLSKCADVNVDRTL